MAPIVIVLSRIGQKSNHYFPNHCSCSKTLLVSEQPLLFPPRNNDIKTAKASFLNGYRAAVLPAGKTPGPGA
jgi:hypothetical protein